MKNPSLFSAFLITLLVFLSSCEIIGGIFKAGVWVGIIVVVGIIGLIVLIIGRIGKK